jgi:alpha-2-macroglobulin
LAKFWPNVLTADVLRKLDVPTEKFNADFESIMRVGRERLLALQQPTGGFAWFDRGAEDPVMTAIVVHGLSECDRLGWKVDAVSLKRGRERLRLFAKDETDLNRLAYQSYVLGEEVDRVLEKKDQLSPYSQALLALTLHRAGRPEAKEVVQLLVKSVTKDHWETGNWKHRWEPMAVETTSYALQALAAVEPNHPLIPMGREWLLAQRVGNRWRSTKDTAVAISALLQITGMDRLAAAVGGDAKRAAKEAFLKKIGVSLNGGEPREILVDLNNPTRSTMEVTFSEVRTGSNTVTFQKLDEKSDFPFDVEVTKRVFEAKADVVSQGVEVKVSTDRALDGLRLGDEVTATVVVSAPDGADYVMVQSPIPAGCEVIRGSGTGPFARFEDRYEKALFFLPTLGKDEVRLTYRMRCSIAGRFTVLPAWAGLMYNEEIYGTTAPATATIKP